MKKPTIRKPYHRERVITDLKGQKLQTDQSQGNDTDVNRIVARFQRTGIMPEGEPGEYADVTGLQGDKTELLERGEIAAKELAENQKRLDDELKTQKQNDENELKQLREQLAAQKTQEEQPHSS